MWDASGPAFCRACSTPVSEISMRVTSQPCLTIQMACRPAPPARSSARPPFGNSGRMYSVKAWGRKGSGSILERKSERKSERESECESGEREPRERDLEAVRYFSFQRSRSLSESELESWLEIEDDMRLDSNPSLGGELRS